MNPLYTTLVCSVCCMNVMAQSINNITGRVQDATGAPLHKVDVYLFTTKDTVLIGQTQSDVNGNFSLKNETKLDAFLLAQCEGYLPVTQKVDKEVIGITLYKNITNSLGEAIVSVTKKSTLKHETDRFIFTPRGLDLEVPTAYDVLKHVPLLNVEGGSFSVMGKVASTIYINGRKPIEQDAALLEKLRSINPEQIAKIEIITSPGASKKASTKGAIINIIIKRNDVGWAGSSNTELSYKNKWSESENLSLRYGKNKFNASIYLNVSNKQWKYKAIENFDYLTLGKSVHNEYNNGGRSNALGGSVDLSYDFNASHKIGLSGSLSTDYSKANYGISTETTLNDLPTTLSRTDRNQKMPFNKKPDYGVLGYYTWTTDKKGSMLNIDIDHSVYTMKRTANYAFSHLTEAEFVPYSVYQENRHNDAQSTNAKANYNWNINDNNAFETGYELNASKMTNRYKRENNIVDPTEPFTPAYDGAFSYKENVQSLFASYKRTWSDVVSSIIGLRAEYAYRKGMQTSENVNFKHHELDWFPSASFDFEFVEDKHDLTLEYSRTVRRPFMTKLDPFRYWNSETSYTTGNPNLKPYFIDNVDIYYTLFDDYIFNFNFIHSKNADAQYAYQDGAGHTLSTYDNFGKTFDYTLSFELNKSLFNGVWRIKSSISGWYTKDITQKTNADGTSFDKSYFAGDISFISTVRLSKRKRWNAEVYASGSTAGKGIAKDWAAYYHVSGSLTKIFDFGGVLQFTAVNLFGSDLHERWSYRTDYYAVNSRNITNNRLLMVSFSVPFGKSRIRGAAYKNSNKLNSKVKY